MAIVVAIAFSLLLVAGLWVTGKAQLLRVALPAAVMFVGIVLYVLRPVIFVQYSLWVWFVAPLVRRIIDVRFGFTEPNFVLLAPLLVSAVAGFSFLPSRYRTAAAPPTGFVFCSAAIFYGFVVGMLQHASAEIAYGLLNWLSPLLLGLHLWSDWDRYEEYKSAIFRTLLWAVLILGAYGIFQFFYPPVWDRYWLEGVMATSGSFGTPEALQIRVWSTSNSPGPFANIMLVGLLGLMAMRSPLKLPAAVAGYLSLLLSVVRTAWLSWAVGFVWLMKSTRPHLIIRAILSMALAAACLWPFINDPRVSPIIGDRMKTMTDIGHDASYEARSEMYKVLVNDTIDHPFGNGLKNTEVAHGTGVDSGFLTLLFSLGWPGTALFAVGLISILMNSTAHLEKIDPFLGVGKATIVALLAQLIGGNIFTGVTGALFWVLVGIYLAGMRYLAGQVSVSAEPQVA